MSKKRGQQHKKSYWRALRARKEAPRDLGRTADVPTHHDVVRVTARSWETLAADEPLRFPVPPRAAGPNRKAFDYWWHLIEYATDLVDPTSFPPFADEVSQDTLRTLRRYVATALDLSRSSALNHPIRMEIKFGEGGAEEAVTSDLPPPDASAGFAVMLRHFYSQNEKASFRTVMNLLRAEVAQGNASEPQSEQVAQLEAWKRAEGTTRARSIENQVVRRLVKEGRAPDVPELATYPDLAPPEKIMSDYFYGDHIHWDSKAEVIEERAADPFLNAMFRHAFFTAAAGLAHLYIGFAALVDAAVSNQETT